MFYTRAKYLEHLYEEKYQEFKNTMNSFKADQEAVKVVRDYIKKEKEKDNVKTTRN